MNSSDFFGLRLDLLELIDSFERDFRGLFLTSLSEFIEEEERIRLDFRRSCFDSTGVNSSSSGTIAFVFISGRNSVELTDDKSNRVGSLMEFIVALK